MFDNDDVDGDVWDKDDDKVDDVVVNADFDNDDDSMKNEKMKELRHVTDRHASLSIC